MNICIVDDEALIRDGIEKRLIKYGYASGQIWKAANALDAQVILDTEVVDLVFADINMPFLSGLELIEKYKGRKLHFIIVSGYDRFEYARKGIELGVEAYLLKPIDKTEFQRVMDEMVLKIDVSRKEEELGKGIRRIAECIREHWQDPAFCLQDCAARLNLSEGYIGKQLKREGQESFVELLNQYRIDQAIRLLKQSEGQIRIHELARQCGFTTPQYFSTVFRKHTGMTPSQYKDQHG